MAEKRREKYSSSSGGHDNSFKAMSACSRDRYHYDEPRVMTMPAPSCSLVGFSWPPRSYTCSFCKREFRSAQALGGHMNVHRRDRARLRQQYSSPPPSPGQLDHQHYPAILKPNPKSPNIVPNLNMPPPPLLISSSLSTTRDEDDKQPSPLPFMTSVIPASLILSRPHASSPSSSSSSSSSSTSFLFGVRKWRNFMDVGGRRKDDQVMMKHGLDDCVCAADHVVDAGSLDLELRLGYT